MTTRIFRNVLLVLSAAASAASADPAIPTTTTRPDAAGPVHPRLEVLKRHQITEYPIIAWCFHGRGGGGYDEAYVRAAKGAGFNVLIESQEMLKPAKKVGGVKIMAVAFRFNTWRIERQTLNRFGADHPALMGFVLDDNCPRISGNSKHVATWLKQKHPRLVPFVSENHDTRNQIKTNIRILGTQNSRMKRGDARAADGYCGRMEMDRNVANMYRMSFWPLWYGMASAGAVRFQIYAAVAYGAQGVIVFAYTPNKAHWKPDGRIYKAHAHAAGYVHDVIGRHVLGTRSMGVLHSSGMGARTARSNRWVARMDDGLIAGMLFAEKSFYARDRDKVPTYVMVVHKRFVRGAEPPARVVRVDFGPGIHVVEVLERKTGSDADKIRKIEPAFSVPISLLTGDGKLLAINPDLEFLGSLAGPYRDICKEMSGLMARVRATRAAIKAAAKAADPQTMPAEEPKRKGRRKKARPAPKPVDPGPKAEPLAPGEFEKLITAIQANAVKLAAGATDAQAKDTTARLTAAVTYIRQRAPKPHREQP